jgi:hypothetical protein
MAVVMPAAKQAFFTSTGIPLVGGRVRTFAAGTSTPKATFADAAGTIPNANPVVLDARGEALIYWAGGYKVQLEDSTGAVIWTVDNYVASDSTPSDGITVLPSATVVDIGAATTRTVSITGVTGISSFGSTGQEGAWRFVRFASVLVIAYDATSMVLPGNNSVTTAANDSAIFYCTSPGNWVCTAYFRNTAIAPVVGETGALRTYGPVSVGTPPFVLSPHAMRNRVINGCFRVNQRGAPGTLFPVTVGSPTYTTDRWFGYVGAGTGTMQLNVSSSVGVGGYPVNYLRAVTTVADAALAGSDAYIVGQFIEAQNVADLGWGTAGAQPITLSFLARASSAGTYAGAITNAAGTRSYPFQFSIIFPSFWTIVQIVIPGDTAGPAWATGDTIGISVIFDFGSAAALRGPANAWASSTFYGVTGAMSPITTLAEELQIAAVQLERGNYATSFEARPISLELSLCQRYYEVGIIRTYGYADVASGVVGASMTYKATKRITPTVTFTNTFANNVPATPSLLDSTDIQMFSCIRLATALGPTNSGDTWTANAEL